MRENPAAVHIIYMEDKHPPSPELFAQKPFLFSSPTS